MRLREDYVDVRRLLLLVVAIAIGVWTLAPLEFDTSELGARVLAASAWGVGDGPFDALAHFVAFLCFGVLLGKVSQTRSAILLLACFCLGLEAAQLIIPYRHSRIADLHLNAVGGGFGVWLSRRVAFGTLEQRTVFVLRALLTTALLLWLLTSGAPIAFLNLKSWRQDTRLVLGNELDNSEPWMGSISRVAIAPGVRESLSATGASVFSYAFQNARGGVVKAEGSLGSSGLDLSLPERAEPKGILVLTNGPLVSAGSAAKLARALASSGSFTIFADIRETYPSTNIAGRLLSLSSSSSARNFMLGREGNDLVFRVRNGVMEENGARNILRVHNAIDGSAMDVRAVYNRGVATLFNNRALLKRIDLRQPTVYLGLGSGSGAAFSAGLLLGVIVAFPAYCLLPGGELSAHFFAFSGTTLFSFLPYFAVCGLTAAPPALSFAGIATVAIGLAYLVAHLYCLSNVNALRQSGPSGSHSPL